MARILDRVQLNQPKSAQYTPYFWNLILMLSASKSIQVTIFLIWDMAYGKVKICSMTESEPFWTRGQCRHSSVTKEWAWILNIPGERLFFIGVIAKWCTLQRVPQWTIKLFLCGGKVEYGKGSCVVSGLLSRKPSSFLLKEWWFISA